MCQRRAIAWLSLATVPITLAQCIDWSAGAISVAGLPISPSEIKPFSRVE
ncbi:MAG: hypothetical protein AVDCRST_MAG70-220 [uncultured Thermomicrobiales bacterium]|uniref:Uncharacterized protein n=1 Tax=uncultured Thermomicrobiales bacterium TaxID=1645740 RepID=A0A6J4U791_9BACT|nr:MAG: hypothetical protein AVDCRST_MAG70-220 [uncultured Thermomicrobiales bacterium]